MVRERAGRFLHASSSRSPFFLYALLYIGSQLKLPKALPRYRIYVFFAICSPEASANFKKPRFIASALNLMEAKFVLNICTVLFKNKKLNNNRDVFSFNNSGDLIGETPFFYSDSHTNFFCFLTEAFWCFVIMFLFSCIFKR